MALLPEFPNPRYSCREDSEATRDKGARDKAACDKAARDRGRGPEQITRGGQCFHPNRSANPSDSGCLFANMTTQTAKNVNDRTFCLVGGLCPARPLAG